jgi:uncharacterized protein YgbK (DUF1537 family)
VIVAVIADDLSGAAELAGAAAEMGYSAEMHTSFDSTSHAEVIAIDTDTRGMPAGRAQAVVGALTREILRAGPRWIYKKTDSVLRGNVRAEIEGMLEASGLRTAMLISANPGKGRVIRDGVYHVNGVPLAETSFASDPEHPRRSSQVLELLGEDGRVAVAAAWVLSAAGIAAPDVEAAEDVTNYAGMIDEGTLAAGGVEFFRAVMEARNGGRGAAIATSVELERTLFVCGSAQAWEQGRTAQCEGHGMPVLVMPEALCSLSPPSVDAMARWAEGIADTVAAKGGAMAAIGPRKGVTGTPLFAERLAEAVAIALRRDLVGTICIEGGATAAALLHAMRWTRLSALPARQFPGVAVLRPDGAAAAGPTLLVKPGSYPWPDGLWSQWRARRG